MDSQWQLLLHTASYTNCMDADKTFATISFSLSLWLHMHVS